MFEMRCLSPKEAVDLLGQTGFSVLSKPEMCRTTLVLEPKIASRQNRVGGRPTPGVSRLVPPSGSCDSALREGTEVVLTTLLFGNKTGVESVTLWHDESEAETGGCDAPISRRTGDG